MAAKTRRFGVLVPPGNVAVETELPRFLPAGVQMHTSRLYRKSPEVSVDGHLEMLRSVEQASLSVAQTAPEVILFSCTSASFMQGRGKDREIAEDITKRTGIPAITTATAVAEALAALSAKRIFMVTPYSKEFDRLEVEFIEAHGVKVPDVASFDCKTTFEIRAITGADVAARVLENGPKADAADVVFVSCTNLHAMDQIAPLEAALGKPVVTSNSCTLWAGLRQMEIDGTGLRAGRLFETTLALGRRHVA